MLIEPTLFVGLIFAPAALLALYRSIRAVPSRGFRTARSERSESAWIAGADIL